MTISRTRTIPRKQSDFFMNFSNIEYGDFEQDPDDSIF